MEEKDLKHAHKPKIEEEVEVVVGASGHAYGEKKEQTTKRKMSMGRTGIKHTG